MRDRNFWRVWEGGRVKRKMRDDESLPAALLSKSGIFWKCCYCVLRQDRWKQDRRTQADGSRLVPLPCSLRTGRLSSHFDQGWTDWSKEYIKKHCTPNTLKAQPACGHYAEKPQCRKPQCRMPQCRNATVQNATMQKWEMRTIVLSSCVTTRNKQPPKWRYKSLWGIWGFWALWGFLWFL